MLLQSGVAVVVAGGGRGGAFTLLSRVGGAVQRCCRLGAVTDYSVNLVAAAGAACGMTSHVQSLLCSHQSRPD